VVETLQDKHDAFYVGNLGDIICKYKNWVTQLPRVEPFYGMQLSFTHSPSSLLLSPIDP